MSRLQIAIDGIVFARDYTKSLLEQTPESDWLRFPPGGISHIGWQVGHLAFAEYRLALWRIRGERPEDASLFTPDFRRLYGAGAVPTADATMSPSEIRTVFERVHEQAMRELAAFNESELDDPVPHPHPFATTKWKALQWCAQHELVHAGQIGLLRRLLGHEPMW